jgi:hypothetical protein
MGMRFSQKFRLFAIGLATFLVVGLASNHLYIQSSQSKTKPLVAANRTQQQVSENKLSPNQLSAISFDSSSVSSISPSPGNSLIAQAASEQNPASASGVVEIIDEQLNPKFNIQGSRVFTSGKLPIAKVNFDDKKFLKVLVNTRKYFQDYATEDPNLSRTGVLETQGITVKDVLNTLDFMIAVAEEDIGNNRPSRLKDPSFINTNFRVIKWNPYNPKRPQQDKVRMTKYAVFTHPASRKRTSTFNTALYSLKDDALTDKFYIKYTKQDVLSGIYEPGGKEFGRVEPLAYLTRTGLEEALMEGTVLINFTDGSQGFFNVDRNNDIPFLRGVAPRAQKRYWYFRQVDAIKGYGYKIDAKISIEPGVTFAGDVLNIGLGKIAVLEHNQGGQKNLRMGIIADTGGAFLPNLYQLDFLSGIFASQKEFKQYIKQLPEFVNAYILVKN